MAQGEQDRDGSTSRPALVADLTALIGWLAVIEGELMAGTGSVPAHLAERLSQRLAQAGLLAPNGDERALRQSINDLNHRLRYAVGECAAPPVPIPVPALHAAEDD